MHKTKDILIMGVTNAARYLKISRGTIYRHMKNRQFPLPETDIEGYQAIRGWRREKLDAYRIHLRGRGRPVQNGIECDLPVTNREKAYSMA